MVGRGLPEIGRKDYNNKWVNECDSSKHSELRQLVDVWGICMCIFSTFSHCSVELGTVFHIHPVFLSDKVIHRHVKIHVMLKLLSINRVERNLHFESITVEPTNPPGTPSMPSCGQHLHCLNFFPFALAIPSAWIIFLHFLQMTGFISSFKPLM